MSKNVRHSFFPKSFTCLFLENYSFQVFKKDLIAGITIGIIALPLAMAFSIASGVSPERGLFTAIIAGFLISLFGGSRVQIGGPTGAFVVIVYDIVQREGYAGLVLATLMAAVLLLIMGFAKLGTLIKYVPYPLIMGFTAGIAVIIFSSQIKDFLGLNITDVPADFIPKWKAFLNVMDSWDPWTLGVSIGTLALIVLVRKFAPFIPWGIAAIVIGTLICWLGEIPVVTIADRYGEIPRMLPLPSLPNLSFSIESFRHLIPDAFTIALLAGIESLLSAVVADGMSGGKHKSNCELIGQGIANLGSAFFGGIPATGAIARTAANIKVGAKTPVAGMIHAVTLFLIILAFAPLVSLIPLAILSAVLVIVAWNMSEAGRFYHLLKAPLSDVIVLFTAFFLTIFANITLAVGVGVIVAAFLFIKHMSDSSLVVPFLNEEHNSENQMPKEIKVFEMRGPFFFGVVDRLQDLLENMESCPKILILHMRNVPIIDATGLHALNEFSEKCKKKNVKLLFSEMNTYLSKAVLHFEVDEKIGKDNIFPHTDAALTHAKALISCEMNSKLRL